MAIFLFVGLRPEDVLELALAAALVTVGVAVEDSYGVMLVIDAEEVLELLEVLDVVDVLDVLELDVLEVLEVLEVLDVLDVLDVLVLDVVDVVDVLDVLDVDVLDVVELEVSGSAAGHPSEVETSVGVAAASKPAAWASGAAELACAILFCGLADSESACSCVS